MNAVQVRGAKRSNKNRLIRKNWALLTYVWGKMTTEAGSVKGVLMAVGVAKLEEETHG